MSRKHLFIVWLPVLLVLCWHNHVGASQRIECCKGKGQTRAMAGLKHGDFIRVRTASGRVLRGYIRTYDGSRLVLEEKGGVVTVEAADIVLIKRGRGFVGSLRHGFSRAARTLASPVTEVVKAYQMARFYNEWL